jgi:NAD(P)-dependent dehydrogenase (short-subunit alcohol dehydrogenase family)
MSCLEGKWALITGSSRGIGQHIAAGLARHGCNIIVHGRTVEHTQKTLELLKDSGVEVAVTTGDLGTETGVREIVDGVLAKVNHVEILYNNAAIMNPWKDHWNISMDEWRQMFQINFFAVVKLCNVFIPRMLRRGWGRVVNLTSGIKDVPQLAPYSVTKAAIDKYTLDLASELKGTDVLVNTVDPGWLKTDLGGPNADHEVETVLPGALVPALLEDFGPSGNLYHAQDFKYLK